MTFQTQVDKKVVGHVASVAQTRLSVSDTLTFPFPLIARCLATLGLRHRAIGSTTQDLLPTSCVFSRYLFSRPKIKYFSSYFFIDGRRKKIRPKFEFFESQRSLWKSILLCSALCNVQINFFLVYSHLVYKFLTTTKRRKVIIY